MGGRVGLKGSDGEDILEKAIQLGAIPECPNKAVVGLCQIKEYKGEILEIYTYPNEMGEDEVRAAGLNPIVIGKIESGNTKSADTTKAANDMYDIGVDLILFAGGDGTARNILDVVGEKIPVLGIPGGCKIHSAVYAINPKSAGKVVVKYLEGKVKNLKESEVMDIDEDAFRDGILKARLYGYMKVPNENKLVQNMKSGSAPGEDAALDFVSRYIAFSLEKDVLYIMGSGSTVRGVMDKLGIKNTLLGVDLIYNNQLIANDVNEYTILTYLGKYNKAKIIITVIGGQGYLFGRGNQQLSPKVIRKVGIENIIIISTKNKMNSLFGKPLLVDTGDEELNDELNGYAEVIVGFGESVMFKVVS
ncbi:MAG: ATP-NAD kinase family protein [Peptostreptococcaceae bacterium]|nr:ATP-NAD kinase family protein [Peptostreptococcaceae bacterium]